MKYAVAILVGASLAMTSLGSPILAVDLSGTTEEGFQAGFTDIVNGTQQTSVSKSYTTDATLTSGTITVEVSASSSSSGISYLSKINNRQGLSDNTPAGFTYTDIYSDIINATSATGVLTLKLSGLNANEEYNVTVYSYDPVSTGSTADKVWDTVTGTASSGSQSVNYSTTSMTANDTFAMDFTVTSTADGVIEIANTAGYPQNALNAFSISIPEPSTLSFISLTALSLLVIRRFRM